RRVAWLPGGGALLRRRVGQWRRAAATRSRRDHQAVWRARSARRLAPARAGHQRHPSGEFMNQLTPYAAFFMRLAVGGVFLQHGLTKFHNGIPAVAGFLHGIGFPFATIWAVILIAVETVGAVCVLLGSFTRAWSLCMAIEMLVPIFAVKLPHG